jgi:AraC-like DNA-binding protein
MRQTPMISLAAATGLVERLAAGGIDADKVLGAAGLDRAVLSQSAGFVPTAAFALVLEEAARASGDSCFGLHFGEQFEPKDIGALTYVILNSPTVGAAMQDAVRYIRIHNRGATVWLAVEAQHGHLRYSLGGSEVDSRHHHSEFSMTVALRVLRVIAGPQWIPHEVHLAHEAPEQTSEHVRIFGCKPRFARPFNAIVFEQDLLERPVDIADSRLYRVLKQHVEHVLTKTPSGTDLHTAVRRTITERMGQGPPNLSHVARALSMSPRTLERRLREHGIAFKELVSEMRRRLALEYMADGDRTLAEIAFLLGYSEVTAFNRAFKRWVGSSPSQYRASLSRESPHAPAADES